jgi:predicted nucleic-acid-binding Zn-ribbon protein
MQFNCTINIDILSPKLETLTKVFFQITAELLQTFFKQVLLHFAQEYLTEGKIQCDRCKSRSFKWKTHNGTPTKLVLFIGILHLNQLQVQCKSCGHKMYITRFLLGVMPRKRIPDQTVKRLGLIGALTTYRVANKIVGMFGITLDKMNIWRCVQKVGESLRFDLDPDEEACGEADGTGIPIKGIKKRGKELKVFVQLKKQGGVRVAGLSIGNYDSQWDSLFKPLLPSLKRFKRFLLVTDGDTSILKGLGDSVTVLFQRCLWHIPHQFKWYLWKDKVKHKSDEWRKAFSELISVVNVRVLQHDTDCIDDLIKSKRTQLEALILLCTQKGWSHCTSYLENSKKDLFTALSKRLNGKTTSHAERVMRTVNMRVNVGKWSTQGALNVNKIRLGYYYNGFDVD